MAIQAAGYELMGAYFENELKEELTTADRLTLFSLFTTCKEWATETWEPRLKALRGMTGYGTDILGIEETVLELLKFWIQASFDGLLVLEARAINVQEGISPPSQSSSLANERNERNDRERCITLCAEFISKVLEKSENVARIPDEELDAVIAFYGTLVDRAVQLPRTKGYDPASEDPDDLSPVPSSMPSIPTTSVRSAHTHKRTTSTSTIASVTNFPPVIGLTHLKHPAEIAIHLYLTHLSSQSKMLSPRHLQDVIPTLFRATAFCATPLSRLSVVARNNPPSTGRSQSHASTSNSSPNWKRDAEERITTFLGQLFTGPYAALTKLIQKVWVGPPETTPDIPAPPPLFLTEFPPPSHSADLFSTPHELQLSPQALLSIRHLQGQQILPGPAAERRSSLTNSPIPTQPATPVPSILSLPPPHVPLTMPMSPMAGLVSPVQPSVSLHIHSPLPHPSSSTQQAPSSASASVPGPSSTSLPVSQGQAGYSQPLHPTSSTLFKIHTSLGAHRALRTALRRSLISRLARTYISREASLSYTMGGVPARMDVELEAMERAWPNMGGTVGVGVAPLGDAVGFLKEAGGGPARGHEWDIVRIGLNLRWAARCWIDWEVGMEKGKGKGSKRAAKAKDDREERQRLKEATERVLEEIAGVLKDLLQEVDERGDDDYAHDYEYAGGAGAGYAGANPSGVAGSQLEEDESVAIGETLFQLAGWFRGLRWVVFTLLLRFSKSEVWV